MPSSSANTHVWLLLIRIRRCNPEDAGCALNKCGAQRLDFWEFYRGSRDDCLRTVLIMVGDQDTAHMARPQQRLARRAGRNRG
jgi:hypothetical protein